MASLCREPTDNEEHSIGSAHVRSAARRRRTVGVSTADRIHWTEPPLGFGRAIAFMGIESTF